MPSRATIITLAFIIIVLVVVGIITYRIRTQAPPPPSAADLTLGTSTEAYTSFAGDPTSLTEYQGTIRVVSSWASFSPLSVDELKNLNQLAKKYQDRGVVVLAINRNENTQHAQRFLDQIGPLDFITFVADTNDGFFDRMDGQTVPETLFFDADGNLIEHVRGPAQYLLMEQHVEAALAAGSESE